MLVESYDEKQAGYYAAFREDLLRLVPDGVSSVLEIGCGSGNLGESIRAIYGCRVTGIEIVPEIAAEASSKLDCVVTGPADDALRELAGESFDCLIFGDSLEHLPNPAKFLASVRSVLAENAFFVISIPNVAHWSVIRMLMQGHWQYDRGGIMDDTHLRWFTLRSIADLLADLGYQIERVEAEFRGGPGMPRRLLRSCCALNMDMRGMDVASQCYQYRLVGRLRVREANVSNPYSVLIDQLQSGAMEAYWGYELAQGRFKWLWRNYSPALLIDLWSWLKRKMRLPLRVTLPRRVASKGRQESDPR